MKRFRRRKLGYNNRAREGYNNRASSEDSCERVINKLINVLHFGVVQRYGTTRAISILRELQENYVVKENLYFSFADLERNVVW